jgi:excinuclease ABC subunit A
MKKDRDKNNNFRKDDKNYIVIKGCKVNNLKNIDLKIPKYKLVVFTGVSGSGKSSIVFDTIYAEGQRRYVESLSSYARQFLEKKNKPDVEYISGLAPSMAIEQKTRIKNPRSTVGTTTEIYDYLRLLFARIGKTYSPVSGKEVIKDSIDSIISSIKILVKDEPLKLLIFCEFNLSIDTGINIKSKFKDLKEMGFDRILLKNRIMNLEEIENDEYLIKKLKKLDIVIDRFTFDLNDEDSIMRINDSLDMAYREGEGYLTVRIFNGEEYLDIKYSQFLETDGIIFEEPEPRLFSFNNPFGACGKCQGFGKTIDIDMDLVIPDKRKSISARAIAPFSTLKHSRHLTTLLKEARKRNLDTDKPFNKLSEDELRFVFNGGGEYIGINKFFKIVEREAGYKLHYRVLLKRYRAYTNCNACNGSRLRKEALYIKISGKTIHDIVKLKINDAYEFFRNLKLNEYDKKISSRLMEEIIFRLKYLNDVGLTYLTLDRTSNTLSGGESQRINLSTSLGSSLVGSVYVLDEPSIGLHPRDNKKLIDIMKSLRDIGNTVLVVEHDRDMMKSSDEIIDIGPFAGENGGKVVFQGDYKKILKDENSLTGKYLSGNLFIPIPGSRREINKSTKFLKIKNASKNNLKNIDVQIPLNFFTCITGVSGSGKSTLVNEIIYPALKRKLEGYYETKLDGFDFIEGSENLESVELVDQSPIGRTSRSNPVTYIKAFDFIREAFSNTIEAKKRFVSSGYFSFNVPGGRCEVCEGTGIIKIEMQFMADIELECEMCRGKRYKSEVLEIKLRGADGTHKNISEILDITVNEAIKFLKPYPKITRRLQVLEDVGLGYIKLGQSGGTLSGGESQRVKLAYNIAFREEGVNKLFIFDEPTTGLHYHDISKLLKCFDELVKQGNSVLVIEHNLEVIKCADYIIDLGPESGDEGGYIVTQGTPEEIIREKKSFTGNYLAPLLS